MAATKMTGANHIKSGSYMVIEGVACKVTSVQVSRPGKHGHAKNRIEGVGLIDDKKRVVVVPGHDPVEVPIVEKKSAQVLSVTGNMANVMDAETFETFDLAIPDELKDQVTEGVNILFWEILNDKIMKQIKAD